MRSWSPAPLLSLFSRHGSSDRDDATDEQQADATCDVSRGEPEHGRGGTPDSDDPAGGHDATAARAPAADPAARVLEASQLMTEVLDRAMIRAIAVSTAVELLGGDDGAFVRGHGAAARWVPDVPRWAPEAAPAGEPTIARALATGHPTVRPATTAHGEPCTIGAAPVLVDGRVVGALVVARLGPAGLAPDAAERLALLTPVVGTAFGAADALLGATTAAEVDALTALPNRRRLDADLALLRRDEQVALAMLDVDHFKHFNDTNGHVGGDRALRAVAAAVAGSVRPADLAYRYGGEELAVVLRGCDGADAEAVMARVHAAVRALDVEGAASQPLGHLSVSIGVASSQDGPLTTLQARADAALYAAKATGRDRTVLATRPLR